MSELLQKRYRTSRRRILTRLSLQFLCRAAPCRRLPPERERRSIEIKIDGKPVSVPEGSTDPGRRKQTRH